MFYTIFPRFSEYILHSTIQSVLETIFIEAPIAQVHILNVFSIFI
jgi:hypothetical protein